MVVTWWLHGDYARGTLGSSPSQKTPRPPVRYSRRAQLAKDSPRPDDVTRRLDGGFMVVTYMHMCMWMWLAYGVRSWRRTHRGPTCGYVVVTRWLCGGYAPASVEVCRLVFTTSTG